MRSVRPHLALVTVLLLALTWWGALAQSAQAAEEILNFDVALEVRRNGDLIVTETITVRAEGIQIRHGIYRDFPLTFRYPDGSAGRVGFEVLRVKRDGQYEPWFVRHPSASIARVYMGDRDRYVTTGVHTYALTYRTTRQIRFFPDHDELYWNVTGNAWAFPIHRARVRVILPEGARIIRHALYTGKTGSRESDARVLRASGNLFEAETTRTLVPGEGFTIALAFPKGFVAEPSRLQRLWWRLQDMIGPVWLLAGTGVVVAWFLYAWWRYGRDPASGIIIPRWEPPQGISPAATHWLVAEASGSGAEERRAFIAALISLATKGFIELGRDNDNTVLRRRKPAATGLPPGETLLMNELFSTSDTFTIRKESGDRLNAILERFSKILKEEVERAHVVRNRFHFAIGMVLVLITLGGLVALALLGHASATTTLFMSIFVLLPSLIVGRVAWTLSDTKGTGFWITLLLTLFLAGVLVVMFGPALFARNNMQLLPTGWHLAVFAALIILPMAVLAAWYMLPRPTASGRKLLDEIEGLRMFIETAEKERLNRVPASSAGGAPDMSAVLFERLLPWAIALGLEEPWTRAFHRWLDKAATAAGYQPSWYHGGSLDDITSMDRSGGLVSSLDSSIVSALPAPDISASGFGSGGGSGGGGGGGGGGGW